MNDLLWWFGQNTLATLLMIPCVMLACRLFRNRPAAQHLLWLVVLVKFATPPVVAWPWTLEDLRSVVWSQDSGLAATLNPSLTASTPAVTATNKYPVSSGPQLSPSDSFPNAESIAPLSNESVFTERVPATLHHSSSVDRRRLIACGVVLVWFAGAIACLVSQLRRLIQYARIVRKCEIAPLHLKYEVSSVASLLRMKAPACVLAKGISSPFLWCVGAVRLVWPDAMSRPADVARSRGIIAHELAHLRRRDHWIAWVELVTSLVWWWNPLFWFARRRLRETAEMSCDALAVAANPAIRHEYAEALLQLSIQSVNGAPATVLAVGAVGSHSFERRLKMILSTNVSSKLSWGGILTMAVFAVITLPYLSLAQLPAEPEPSGRVDSLLSMDMEDVDGTSAEEMVIEGIRYLHPPVIAQSLTVEKDAWGPVVEGLTAAFIMSDVGGRGDDSMLVNGALVVKNVSEKPIWFSETAAMAVPDIYDVSGTRLELEGGLFTSVIAGHRHYQASNIVRRTILAPGEQCVLSRVCELAVFRKDRADREANDIHTTEDHVVVSPGKYSVAVRFMPGLLSEADWNQMAKRTVPSIQFDNHGRNQAVDLPDFYEDNQVVARTVPGEWTGTLQTGKVDFRAFDDRGAMQFNESLKVSADVNDNLRISSRDGRLTFFKRDGTLRLHDQLARYALLALLPSGDNRFAVEGVSKERILCMRTLVDSSNRRLKIFDLCSGDQLAHFQPNDEGELEPQDRSQEPQASKANQSHCIQTARAGKAAAQFDLTRLDRIIRREPEYRSKKTAILSVGIWQDAGSALVDSRP